MYPVYISESKVSFQGRPAGQGVFASRDINKGEVVDKGVFKHVDDCLETSKFVQKFCYTGTGPHFSKYIIFGYGSMMNKGDKKSNSKDVANVKFKREGDYIVYTAIKKISKGKELLLEYKKVPGLK